MHVSTETELRRFYGDRPVPQNVVAALEEAEHLWSRLGNHALSPAIIVAVVACQGSGLLPIKTEPEPSAEEEKETLDEFWSRQPRGTRVLVKGDKGTRRGHLYMVRNGKANITFEGSTQRKDVPFESIELDLEDAAETAPA